MRLLILVSQAASERSHIRTAGTVSLIITDRSTA